jgi:excisionase family DNA binding protein
MTTLDSTLRTMIAEIVREEMAKQAPSVHPEYLSPRDAGEFAGVTAATIRRWIREGKLPAHHAGARVRVLRSDLERLLRSGHSRKASSDLGDETPLQAAAALLRSVG